MAEIELFTCQRRSMRLTTRGCSDLWKSTIARPPQPFEGRHLCVLCPVGAANSGVVIAPMAQTAEDLRMLCPRCVRPAARLINDAFCVSCFNRHREALRGRNAKGTRPALADQLHTECFTVIHGVSRRSVEMPMVTGLSEAMIAVLRKSSKSRVFFAPAPVALGAQLVMPFRNPCQRPSRRLAPLPSTSVVRPQLALVLPLPRPRWRLRILRVTPPESVAA